MNDSMKIMSICSLALLSLSVYGLELSETVKDLTTPAMTDGKPEAGKRVKQVLPNYRTTDIYHVLYLPRDWQEGRQYPLIVEYAGNRYKHGPGTPESCDLGYGISAGTNAIWLCLPYVDKEKGRNAPSWWGDVNATVAYCKSAVKAACDDFGADPQKVVLAGFSRGAIACNYIGLHDDEIASLWKGFVCHSHYDGVRNWGYEGADRKAATTRLARLRGRPQFICQENSVAATEKYLKEFAPDGSFTFVNLPFKEHTDTWVLHDIATRKHLREWFHHLLK